MVGYGAVREKGAHVSALIQNRRWRQRTWDYSREATYLITLSCVERGRDVLGALVVEEANLIQPKVSIRRTPLGECVAQLWEEIRLHVPNVKSLGYCVMPDHFHGVLWVQRPLKKPLGEVVRGFKIACTQAYRTLINEPTAPGVWAPGFDDKILSHREAVARACHYVEDNPRRLAIKRLARDYFTQLQEVRIPLRLSAEGGPAFDAHFSGLGNRFLLERPFFYQVQVSRRDFRYQPHMDKDAPREVAFSSEVFEAKRHAMLEAAQRGAVIVSPFLSQGEQALCRLAVEQGFPVIQLRNQGLPPLFKPQGRFFDLCAQGNYLLLAPWKWKATAGKKALTRDDALVLNRIAQCLCGADALPIHYHGVQPLAIDVRLKEVLS